ncbi:hypothetical protein D3C81_1272930 [compost metagenome]
MVAAGLAGLAVVAACAPPGARMSRLAASRAVVSVVRCGKGMATPQGRERDRKAEHR